MIRIELRNRHIATPPPGRDLGHSTERVYRAAVRLMRDNYPLSPTIREIADAAGFESSTAQYHCNFLVEAGVFTRAGDYTNRHRTLWLARGVSVLDGRIYHAREVAS